MANAADTRQKKPTTANRLRLEAAISEVRPRMRNVYSGSVVVPEELAKFPADKETEMLEQKEDVDLSGEIHLEREVFVEWLDKGQQEPQRTPCAVALMQLSIDKQSMDLRGAVSGDTAWELCCRILSKQDDAKTMGTRELAQLLVYNLEEHQLPLEMGTAIYDGMREDLQKRGKTIYPTYSQ